MWNHLFQPCLIWTLTSRLFTVLCLHQRANKQLQVCSRLISPSRHHDESLNERADINEASPPPLAKAGLYIL